LAGFVSEERLAYGSWQAFERMLARLLIHSGFNDVIIVGGSGDNGADIVGTFENKRWVVQAKFRQSGVVEVDGALEAIKAMSVYKADIAVLATNQAFSQNVFAYRNDMVSNGIDLRLWEGYFLRNTFYPQLSPMPARKKELRQYQADAVDAVEKSRENSKNSLVIMATGLGKSVIINQLILNEIDRNPKQEVLVLAHMTDLIRQLEFSSWFQLNKCISTHIWTDGESPKYPGGVIFATWQTINSAIRQQSIAGRFGLVLVDEAHHAPSVIFSSLIYDLKPNFLVGLTATPWRGDEKDLTDIFGPITFKMDIIDGMMQGFLAEVDYRMLTDGIDWSEIAKLSIEGNTIKDLNAKLILPERDVAMVEKFYSHFIEINNPRAIVFCKSKQHAELLQPIFASFGIKSMVLHSGMAREQRFFSLSSFRAGLIDCILSVDMLNEGIDVPDVNIVAFMRVTHNRRIFIQQLGRGLRINDGKNKVLVLDFVADIRRISAGLTMNKEARERSKNPEVIRYTDGRIVNFSDDFPLSFFTEYLADVAAIENMDDGATLRFPDKQDYFEITP
jgi:superfamily II DNA or RNA helicase